MNFKENLNVTLVPPLNPVNEARGPSYCLIVVMRFLLFPWIRGVIRREREVSYFTYSLYRETKYAPQFPSFIPVNESRGYCYCGYVLLMFL